MAKDKLDQFRHERNSMDAVISFKTTDEDKKAFIDFCKKNKLKTGKVLRHLLNTFMTENA